MRIYRSLDEAWLAFDRYAQTDPRLRPLWDLCRRAAPPVHTPDDVDDVFDFDPFEIDPLAADNPRDGWCAEDYFLEHVKSKLLLLAGLYRLGPPHPLHSREAFEEIYDLLLNWALNRPCACCSRSDRGPQPGDDASTVHP
jgi:hypothetical protein